MSAEEVIVIKDHAAISAMGSSKDLKPEAYVDPLSCMRSVEIEGVEAIVAPLPEDCSQQLSKIQDEIRYKKLDRSVIMAILAARNATKQLRNDSNKRVLINIGSSRGATSLFEKYFRQFLERGTVPVQTSPTTTLGNISSWVAQDLDVNAACLSTSVTCSTALQAFGNAIAWLKSGMADIALAGASEAPLTAFTIAQMRALRIYAESKELQYPCQPCANEYSAGCGMVLGEGAAVFVLEKMALDQARSEKQIIVESIGFGREQIDHATAITEKGDSLYEAMSMALKQSKNQADIDLVILHAPGTERGDASELAAIERMFPDKTPILLSNKWKLGHTFGVAGAINVDYAINILKQQTFADFPYPVKFNNQKISKVRRIMINAAGFGGNATSLILSM